jgi:hypothetical protein
MLFGFSHAFTAAVGLRLEYGTLGPFNVSQLAKGRGDNAVPGRWSTAVGM